VNDVIRWFTTLDPWSVLLFSGIALVALGVIGFIPSKDLPDDKRSIGKWGRIAAVFIGGALIITGIVLIGRADSEPISTGDLSPQARKSADSKYIEFEAAQPHKAMAASDRGWLGLATNRPTTDDAKHDAMDFCRGYAGRKDACRVVIVDEKREGGW